MNILDDLNIVTSNKMLYETAFTHTSYSNEHDCNNYERLEFLGDAVLELIISDYLYNEKNLEEGSMTKMRASYVCEEACHTYSKELGFDKYIRLGSGEDMPNATIMADVFESFVGAMYLDKGFEYTNRFVLEVIVKYIKRGVDFLHDYKSELQELVQTVKKSVVYEIIAEAGPAHDKTFLVNVLYNGIVLGTGSGKSKKEAEENAAKSALDKGIL